VSRRIPNVFHFVFGLRPQTEAFHLLHYLCLESCRQVCQPERIRFYYLHEPHGRYWELIRGHLELVKVDLDPFVSSYRYRDPNIEVYSYAHQSDFIRLQKLVEAGGVYADMDTIFVNPIPAALFEERFVLGREDDVVVHETGESRRSLCNAFMMAEPGAEFGRLWLARMRDAFDGSWSNHSTVLPQVLSEERPEWIHVEPPRTFYKHMWTPAGIGTLLLGDDGDNEGVVSFHLWSHLWWARRRTDFSRAHAGMFTERFIRTRDTTYNRVARQFLPPPVPRRGIVERVRDWIAGGAGAA